MNTKNLYILRMQKKCGLKLGPKRLIYLFKNLFANTRKGDHFVTQSECLQEYFSDEIITALVFDIIIEDIVPAAYVCFDAFKSHFKLKTNKEVHQKMTEVFSFRNDISLRRHIVEEALKLMVSKHMIEIPQHLILRKQEEILASLQQNPDYQIYKLENNFKEFVANLSIKQVKETILIDQLIHNEAIKANANDVRGYLNLHKRPRTKEFIYFQLPSTKIDGRELPIANSVIEKVCTQEKALNYLIYHLTRK